MKKKLIALLLVVVMVMAIMPTMALAHEGTHDEHNHKNDLQFIRVRIQSGSHGDIYSPWWQDDPWQGDNWTFTAIPDSGYKFSHWTYSGNEASGAFFTSGANGEVLNVIISQKGVPGYLEKPSWRPSTWYWVDADFMKYKAQAVFVVDDTVYDVTLDLGAGGTFDSNGLSTIVVSGQRGDTFVVPPFTENPGYDHIEWTETPDFSSSRTIGSRYEYEVTFAGNAEITITGGSPAWTVNHNVSEPSYDVAGGYRFDGWDRSLNGITAPTTINANPAVGRGTISLEHTSGGELYGEGRTEGTFDNGTMVRLGKYHYDPDTCRIDPDHGWKMRGWKVGDTDVILPWDVTVEVNGDETYTAVFYDSERLRTTAGANGSLANPVDTWEYARGDQINLNTLSGPQADYGYMFDKWVETSIIGNYQRDVALVGGEPIITIGDSNYFEAYFKPAEYTVTFVDSQGDTLGTETVLHGGDVTKTAGSFTYDAGERPVGSGWDATEGQNITAPKTIVVNTEYEVTFDLNGGTRLGGGELVQWVEFGSGATGPILSNPAGAQFDGWDKPFAVITQAETITAKYVYLVQFVDDAGNVLASEYVASGGDAATTPGSITLGSGKRYKNSPAWDPALGQNITAQTSILVELEYEVRFDLGGGTWTGGGALSQWIEYGGSATAPVFDDPVDANFIEWDTVFDNITSPTYVTAVYEYLVEFVDDAGNVLASEYVRNGEDAVTVKGDISLGSKKRFKNSPAWDPALGQNITAPTDILVELEYRVRFRLNGGTRTGGGTLTQWIAYGGSATAPTLNPPTGKVFSSWSKAFNNITSPKVVRARYSWIDYTLTINFLDRADNSVLVPAYTGTYHYGDTYSIISPAVLAYDLPSIDTVAGTMPADDVEVTVYYDAHTFKLTYMQHNDDLPTDLREYRIYHKDSVSDEYPVKVGYKLAGSSTIVEIGEIEFINDEANRFSNPFLFNTTPIGISPAGETCIIYWYDEDNQEWIQADTKAGSTLYQATFDANGGAFADTSIVKFDYAYVGGNIVSPDLPTKEGHTFIGWDVNGDGVIDTSDDLNSDGIYDAADIDEIAMSANIVIPAIYEINTFEVRFFDHDGTQIGVTQTVDWNTAATAPADPTREGHTFTGWDKAFDAVTTDLDVTATYTINTFEVKFFDHDGTQIGATQTIDWNTAATAPADPTREGHTFAGWDKAFDAVTTDLDVTATYTINTFEVKFFDHDGTQIGTTQTVDWNTAATAPADPTREGHTFAGWDKAFDAVTTDLDVTATYTINTFEVKFFDHDGTQIGVTQTIDWNTAATAPVDPTREGHTFAGWDKAFDVVTTDLDVTATYTINTFEVKFFDHDGTQIGTTQTVDWNTAATAPADPDRLGHTFAGWDKAFDAVTADLDVTATYTINSYTVTFVDHDGTVLKTERVQWRQAATAPADPTRDGYKFTGWDQEFDRVVRYMTVTAVYEKLDDIQEPDEEGFLVQFFDDEGNLISEQRVEEGGAAEAPEPPEKEGYEFAGWDKEFDPITQDLVVTALYTKLDVPSTDIIEDEPSAEADLTDTTQGSFPWWWIVAGAGAIALLLLILFFVKRRKDNEEEA